MKLRAQKLIAVRPKVTPDPAQTAELERRRAQLAFRPADGFLVDRVQERATKVVRR